MRDARHGEALPEASVPMKHALLIAVPFAALTLAPSAQAIEFGLLRPLQHGPIGDSPQFTEMEKFGAEGGVGIRRSFGKYTRNGDPDSKVTATGFETRVAAGGSFAPTKSFGLTAYIDVTLASDADEESTRIKPDATLDTGDYKHEFSLMGFYKDSPLVFGGGLGLVLIGSETREFIYDKGKYTSEIGSAAMPVLRAFGGISTKQFDGTLGVRFFSMGEAVVEASDPTGAKYEYDIVRRNPGEIYVDARINLGEAKLAASVSYELTAQASEQVDEFSQQYVTVNTTKMRTTGGARRNDDTFKLAVGGRFDPVKLFGIMGGLSYTAASYAKPEYASLEHENLGGVRIDLGTEVKIQKFRGFFNAGYALDSSASFTMPDDSRAETQIQRTQRTPIAKDDAIKMSQGAWELTAGGGLSI